jgi:hypothetical protein
MMGKRPKPNRVSAAVCDSGSGLASTVKNDLKMGAAMQGTIKSYLTAIPLLAGFACPLAAATLGLSINQHSFIPGDVLTLSGSILSTSAGGVPSDLYIELVLPNGSQLTLDRGLAWKPAWSPIVGAIPLANLDAPNFYSTPLPAGLPEGTYSLYLIAVPAGVNPANGSTWIASDKASFTYSAKAIAPCVRLDVASRKENV